MFFSCHLLAASASCGQSLRTATKPVGRTDRKPDVEVRVVRGIEAGYIIVRYGIRYFAL